MADDGSRVYGYGFDPDVGVAFFEWSEDQGAQAFPFPAEGFGPMAVSDDGSIVIGRLDVDPSDITLFLTFLWDRRSGGFELLNGPDRDYHPTDISADGRVFVGRTCELKFGPDHYFCNVPTEAFYWELIPSRITRIPSVDGLSAAISSDGNVVVGITSDQAFRWSASVGGVETLGSLPGMNYSRAAATTSDGSIIIGTSGLSFPRSETAFIWDSSHGMRELQSVLAEEYGLADELAGWTLSTADRISPNGKTISGFGIDPSGEPFVPWIARLTSDGIFFADADSDGMEDAVDVEPTAFSSVFTDTVNGGATTGAIVSRGQQVLFIEDEPAPDGVLISAHSLGGGVPATVSIDGGAAELTLSAGDQVIATHGSVILHVVAGTVEAAFTADNGNVVATASLPAGVALTFEPDTRVFVAAQSNEEPISIVLSGGSVVAIQPGESLNTGLRTVAVDVHPDSVNLNSNGLITVVIFGAADFDAGRVDVGSVRFAGAGAEQWVLVDANQDGRLDLQLKFRRQETELDEIYAQLLADDHDGDGVLDSTRQTAEVTVTGRTIDDVLFSGSGSINLFLAGRNLRELLARLFG
jgi:hypothetical protein